MLTLNANDLIIGFVNPSIPTKGLTTVEYNEIMTSLINEINNGYTLSAFTGRDGRVVVTLKAVTL